MLFAFSVIVCGSNLVAAEKAMVENMSYEEYLIKSLEDENIGHRESAARLLGEQNSLAAVQSLVKMLKSEKDFRVRIVAAVSINNLGDSTVVSELQQIWKNERNKTAKQVLAGVIANLKTQTLTSSN
jgi:HEAT repeat protein